MSHQQLHISTKNHINCVMSHHVHFDGEVSDAKAVLQTAEKPLSYKCSACKRVISGKPYDFSVPHIDSVRTVQMCLKCLTEHHQAKVAKHSNPKSGSSSSIRTRAATAINRLFTPWNRNGNKPSQSGKPQFTSNAGLERDVTTDPQSVTDFDHIATTISASPVSESKPGLAEPHCQERGQNQHTVTTDMADKNTSDCGDGLHCNTPPNLYRGGDDEVGIPGQGHGDFVSYAEPWDSGRRGVRDGDLHGNTGQTTCVASENGVDSTTAGNLEMEATESQQPPVDYIAQRTLAQTADTTLQPLKPPHDTTGEDGQQQPVKCCCEFGCSQYRQTGANSAVTNGSDGRIEDALTTSGKLLDKKMSDNSHGREGHERTSCRVGDEQPSAGSTESNNGNQREDGDAQQADEQLRIHLSDVVLAAMAAAPDLRVKEEQEHAVPCTQQAYVSLSELSQPPTPHSTPEDSEAPAVTQKGEHQPSAATVSYKPRGIDLGGTDSGAMSTCVRRNHIPVEDTEELDEETLIADPLLSATAEGGHNTSDGSDEAQTAASVDGDDDTPSLEDGDIVTDTLDTVLGGLMSAFEQGLSVVTRGVNGGSSGEGEHDGASDEQQRQQQFSAEKEVDDKEEEEPSPSTPLSEVSTPSESHVFAEPPPVADDSGRAGRTNGGVNTVKYFADEEEEEEEDDDIITRFDADVNDMLRAAITGTTTPDDDDADNGDDGGDAGPVGRSTANTTASTLGRAEPQLLCGHSFEDMTEEGATAVLGPEMVDFVKQQNAVAGLHVHSPGLVLTPVPLTADASAPEPNALVFARFNECADWLTNDPCMASFKTTVYNKGIPLHLSGGEFDGDSAQPDSGSHGTVVERHLDNVGRAGHTYLHHIVSHYDHLAPLTVFLSASTMACNNDRSERAHALMKLATETHDSVFPCTFHSDSIQHKFAAFEGANQPGVEPSLIARPYGQWYTHFFGDTQCHAVSCGSMFAVSREHILQHDRAYYQRLLDSLSHSSNPEDKDFLERSWVAVFHPLPSECLYHEADFTPLRHHTRGIYSERANSYYLWVVNTARKWRSWLTVLTLVLVALVAYTLWYHQKVLLGKEYIGIRWGQDGF